MLLQTTKKMLQGYRKHVSLCCIFKENISKKEREDVSIAYYFETKQGKEETKISESS